MRNASKTRKKRCAGGHKRSTAAPTRPDARRIRIRTRSITHLRLLGGFVGGFDQKDYAAPAFPQVSGVDTAQHPPRTAQKPRLMAKSGPISCKTVQKSWGAGMGHRAVAVGADFRAPVCALEGCTLPGSPSLCLCSVKRSCLIMWSWRASRGSVGASAGPPRFPSFPPLPARRLSFASSPYSESGGNTRLQSLSGMG